MRACPHQNVISIIDVGAEIRRGILQHIVATNKFSNAAFERKSFISPKKNIFLWYYVVELCILKKTIPRS